jgi:hypothetical protein
MAAKKKSKAVGKAQVNKTQFVLDLPRELSAKDVVVKAKESGLKLSEAYVYKIRSASKGSAPKAAKADGKVAAPRKDGGMSKVDFVRSLPPGTSYADAAEQAKPHGIELSKAYYYVLKSEAKKAGALKGSPKGRPEKAARASAGQNGLRLSSNDRSEQALIEAVRALGADRARSLIAVIEKFERA